MMIEYRKNGIFKYTENLDDEKTEKKRIVLIFIYKLSVFLFLLLFYSSNLYVLR